MYRLLLVLKHNCGLYNLHGPTKLCKIYVPFGLYAVDVLMLMFYFVSF